MSVLRLGPGVWRDTINHFRMCGREMAECVVYWVGPLSERELVNEVVHPTHSQSAWHYDVPPHWLNEFMVQLHREKRTVRVQVHTHSGRAFHSATDDEWPLVRTPGFLSLVLPRWGREPLREHEMYLGELDGFGIWHRRSIRDRFEGI